MARPRTKKFEFGKGIYYFNIKKGYNNNITIKRIDKKKEKATTCVAFSFLISSQLLLWQNDYLCREP